jgi:uncharacterized protein (TIGR03437 family)
VRIPAAAAIVGLLVAASSQAAYHYVHYPNRSNFTQIFEKFNLASLPNNTVTFFIADQPNTYSPNETFGSVLSQLKQAAAAWNSVGVSDLRVAFGGLETYTDNPTTTRPGASVPNAATPGGDVIFIDTPGVLGLGAPTISTIPVNSPNGVFFPIVRGLVMISRDSTSQPWPSYSEAFFTTAVHEIGHALGLQHTWTGSAMSQAVIRTTSRAKPLDSDDVASLAELYGKSNWQANYGSISGRVTFANNSGGVSLASVVAISPTGPAVSTLSNPDGTYRIDGIPANYTYNVFVHPLPPDALSADDSGLRRPVDLNNAPFNASTPFQTIFYAGSSGTLDPGSATAFPIVGGASVTGIDFSVQPRSAVPTYNVQTYTRIATATRIYGNPGDVTVTGYPGFLDTTQTTGLVIAQAAAPAILPTPQSVTIMGGFAPAPLNNPNYPAVYPYSNRPGDYMGIFILVPPGAGTGSRHMVFNFGSDIYVLPSGIDLVRQGPPVASAVSQNADGTVTVTGAGFGFDSRVFFDGLQAQQGTFNSADGSLTVTPPPGAGSQNAAVTVYNSDGQNSTIMPGVNPPTYTYPSSGTPQILTVSPNSLPAGSSAVIDVTAANMNFVDGQVTLGFGSDDVQVRRVWVLSPTHAIANVSIEGNAAVGISEVSVVSGMQVASAPNGFQVQSARAGAPVIASVVNADPTQQIVSAGSFVTIFGQTLATSLAGVQVLLNDVPVTVVFANATQINFVVPSGFPAGPATLRLTSGGVPALPVILQIDTPPPSILLVNTASNTPLGASSAAAGDVLNVLVTGLDSAVLANPSRVKVTVSGLAMAVQQVTQLTTGLYQIQIVVNQSFGASQVPLAVWVDGVSSAPISVTIR